MAGKSINLEQITFIGPGKERAVVFTAGVNVICGASDTGKSFLAEALDFMVGGSTLKEIPERVPYASAHLKLNFGADDQWLLQRSLAGGNFDARSFNGGVEGAAVRLKQQHAHGRTDNISGFLLDKIGLLNKRILKSKSKGTTVSLSFRNLARLVIVQEGEIQSPQSPFLTGQFIGKTSEIATVKLLLTGIDDSAIVSTIVEGPDNARQLVLIDEILSDLSSEISDMGHEKSELIDQANRLQATIDEQRESLRTVQAELDGKIERRQELYVECAGYRRRQVEISELLARFDLLETHYGVDKERLIAIQESGSLFAHVTQAPCPLCGAMPDSQHTADDCEGDVDAVVNAADAEIAKIDQLLVELRQTVADLRDELDQINEELLVRQALYNEADGEIRTSMSPLVAAARNEFSDVVEKRAEVQAAIDMFDRLEKLQERRKTLLDEDADDGTESPQIEAGIPDSSAHALSMTIERILRSWNFPGECRVHYDKERSDFIIDGKPRGSRGKGLRAITHAAVTLGLMEYCREQSLPHPGFVIMDSPLLAYFEPEGEDDQALQGTDLKERFYEYLIQQHGRDSQVIIIENQHPPAKFEDRLNLMVFTRNPAEGRFGLL
jgi:hypothetical protein